MAPLVPVDPEYASVAEVVQVLPVDSPTYETMDGLTVASEAIDAPYELAQSYNDGDRSPSPEALQRRLAPDGTAISGNVLWKSGLSCTDVLVATDPMYSTHGVAASSPLPGSLGSCICLRDAPHSAPFCS